jgi:hypothetical protein
MIPAMKTMLVVFVVSTALITSLDAQTKKSFDISAVASAGSVAANKYTNSALKLTVDAPNATLKLNPLVNAQAGRARLVQILSNQSAFEDTYTLAVLADTLSNYPQLQSPAHYVRSVRHQLEKEGLSTVREEFPITIGGMQFTGAILQQQVPNGRNYYRGMYATFRNGAILSFDAEAASEEKLNALVKRLVKFSD